MRAAAIEPHVLRQASSSRAFRAVLGDVARVSHNGIVYRAGLKSDRTVSRLSP
jgi:hypothetical protein